MGQHVVVCIKSAAWILLAFGCIVASAVDFAPYLVNLAPNVETFSADCK